MNTMVSPKTNMMHLPPTGEDVSVMAPKSVNTSPNMLKVSTINNDIRIGRSPSIKNNGLASSLSNVRNHRSPNHSRHGSMVLDETSGERPPEGTTNLRKLSNEQIIDLMEKEQDGIVVKLMRDINMLKNELNQWKTGMMPAQLRSPSFDHRLSSFDHRPSSFDHRLSSFDHRLSVVSSTSSIESGERERSRRRSSNEAPPSGPLFEHSQLISENNRLKQENELLRQKISALEK